MRYKLFVGLLIMLIYGGLYAIYTRQTAGSVCRNIGTAIRGMGINDSGAGSDEPDLLDGFKAFLMKTGKSIHDTCDHR